ncbi:putative sugar O-methyltransferase [Granulosicoccus sp.]|nr:putative sugar O-methyltransferase [Granulosicoccus sp.]
MQKNASATDETRYPTNELVLSMQAAWNKLKQQSSLYQPSSFWVKASSDIMNEVIKHGMEHFRALPLPLGYFVPTYGYPGNGISADTKKQLLGCVSNTFKCQTAIERYADGYDSALADYRVLQAADDTGKRPYLHHFSESGEGNPIEQFEFEGRLFSRSSLNYLLGLCLLKRHTDDKPIHTVVEVGGGFGSLGEILLKGADPDIRYIDFDIPPNNAITQFYLSSIFGSDRVCGYECGKRSDHAFAIKQLPSASVFCNWEIEKLQGSVDLFVNFISFQEMEPPIVKNYLSHVNRLKSRWILLRNMREGKQIATPTSVGVKTPILSEDYRQMLPAYDLVERNIIPFGYKTVDGYNSELMLFKRK